MALGDLPLIALVLAATFWIYGLIRKQIDAEALSGLLVECLLMAVPGLAFVAWLQPLRRRRSSAGRYPARF